MVFELLLVVQTLALIAASSVQQEPIPVSGLAYRRSCRCVLEEFNRQGKDEDETHFARATTNLLLRNDMKKGLHQTSTTTTRPLWINDSLRNGSDLAVVLSLLLLQKKHFEMAREEDKEPCPPCTNPFDDDNNIDKDETWEEWKTEDAAETIFSAMGALWAMSSPDVFSDDWILQLS